MKCKGVCDRCKELDGQRHVHDFIPDLDSSAGFDQLSQQHTTLPVPSQLSVRPSSIPGAGLGVFANTFISSNVRVGKFEGKIVTGEQMKDCDTSYAWEVSEDDDSGCYLVDGKDPDHANWLRFVNCARYSEEQNLIAYQYHQNIYYRTIRHIYRNEELLVWYGDDYAKELGLSTSAGDETTLDCQCCGDFMSKETKDAFLEGDKMSYGLGRDDDPGESKRHVLRALKAKGRNSNSGLKRSLNKPHLTDCPVCGKTVRVGTLSRHMICHSEARRYGCKICKKRYKRSDHLKVHMRTVHVDVKSDDKSKNSECKSHGCKVCSSSGDNVSGSRSNVSNTRRLANRPYECEVCEKQFKRKYHLQVHMQKIHKIIKYESNGRRKRTGNSQPQIPASSVVMKERRSIFGGLGLIRCIWCLRVFSSSESLKEHVTTVHKPFKCQLCEERFATKGQLTRHVSEHRSRGPCQCSFCGKVYSRMDSFRRHIRNYCCTAKPIALKSQYGEKNFDHCKTVNTHVTRPVCKKSPSFDHDTKAAGRTGTSSAGGKLQKKANMSKVCRLCKRTFRTDRMLYEHVIKHLNINVTREHSMQSLMCKLMDLYSQKEYKCGYCTATFTKRLSLFVHQKIHIGWLEFSCEHCKAVFEDFRSLNAHLAEHKEEKHICPFCDGSFATVSNLWIHMRRLHCKKHLCHLCPKEYDAAKNLENHLRRTHGVKSGNSDGKSESTESSNLGGKSENITLKDFSIAISPLPIAC